MRDVWTVLTKEWRELTTSEGGVWVNITTLMVFMSIVGILLPWQLGYLWIAAPWVVATWAWIPFFLVTTLTADSVAGERERKTLETLLATRLPDASILAGKLLAAVSAVWVATMACLPVGTITVNLTTPGGPYLPSGGHIAGIGAVVFFAAAFGAVFGVLVSMRAPTVRQAQQTLAIGALALFGLPVLLVRLMPRAWTAELIQLFTGGSPALVALLLATVLSVATLLLLIPTFHRFRRRSIPLH